MLVLVSDGDDTASKATYSQALEAALRNEVMIYTIIDVPIEASAGRDLGGEHALITLAEETGGKSFYAGDGGLDKALRAGQRRSAHPIFARHTIQKIKSAEAHSTGYRSQSPGLRRRIQYPPQIRLLFGPRKRELMAVSLYGNM